MIRAFLLRRSEALALFLLLVGVVSLTALVVGAAIFIRGLFP